ncbi:aspartoacylase [Synechococcus sp. MIT S1220]|uniref:aspartoacylase n=1 Tax=Synechococcus sp. MIT S1220 TaxID=3082549 RepID=UPI0039AEF151
MLQSGRCGRERGMVADVLVVAGTHGNEVNAPWLLDQWQQHPDLIARRGLGARTVIGNPKAFAQNRRYLDRDLNRSFQVPFLESDDPMEWEIVRARQLLHQFGPAGHQPCQVAIDLHSTTAAMGNCLVVYGRRPADLALAALIQAELGLPIYLHESDAAQTGFLVERWPCGLVIEVGPVSQSVLDSRIVRQTRLALETCFRALAAATVCRGRYPKTLLIHRHLGSVDLPRDSEDRQMALLHPEIEGQDWQRVPAQQRLFQRASGSDCLDCIPEGAVPVFINEAAYAEKRIAFSLTRREVLPVEDSWRESLERLMQQGTSTMSDPEDL